MAVQAHQKYYLDTKDKYAISGSGTRKYRFFSDYNSPFMIINVILYMLILS